jgi:transglutaminase-like putative cysteine protease
MDVEGVHDELIVTAESIVDTNDHADWASSPATWDDLADDATRDKFYEYLEPTTATRADSDLTEVARSLAAQAASPAEAADLVLGWVREHLAYVKGSTSVSTSAVEAWRAGGGVCQDFVHLSLALLRAMGIPCRYISGYFYSRGDAVVAETIRGESHAWVEMWMGEWRPMDPTNALNVGERHVLVARGRDYRDVTPLKGVYSGAPPSTPTVSVELTRLE